MSQCPPYRATELTDLLFNCDTFVLTVIQTAANGEESVVSVDLSCILDGKNTVVDVRAECEDKSLVFEFEDGRLLPIDMSCLDTFVTWVHNDNGSVTFISAGGEYTIDVMASCDTIPQTFEVDENWNLVLCTPDGAQKAPIKNVLESIEFQYTQFEDGHGTTLIGEGTFANPYKVDLNICELDHVDYAQDARIGACVGENTVTIPTIKAGSNVVIQPTGRLDVNLCDQIEIDYDPEASDLVCIGSGARRMPVIKAGDNVTIDPDGTLNVEDQTTNPCARPMVDYDQNGDLLICKDGSALQMPAIHAGNNVSIDNSGKLDVTIPPVVHPIEHWHFKANNVNGEALGYRRLYRVQGYGELDTGWRTVDLDGYVQGTVPADATHAIVYGYVNSQTNGTGTGGMNAYSNIWLSNPNTSRSTTLGQVRTRYTYEHDYSQMHGYIEMDQYNRIQYRVTHTGTKSGRTITLGLRGFAKMGVLQ